MRPFTPFRPIFILGLLALALFAGVTSGALAQQTAAATAPIHGRLLLALPFENRSSQTSLDWISESVPEVLNQRLASAGFLPISRTDRLYALDHLGLPPTFQPSRASQLRLAQTLDADYVITGIFRVDGNQLHATAQILDVSGLRLGPPIEAQADLVHLLDLLNGLAWQVARQLDPTYAVAEQTFLAASAKLRLDAFENYVRGLVEDSSTERIRHLKEAVRLSPDYYPAWLALGRAYFDNQQYELTYASLGKLPRTDPNALEAQFYRGLSFFFTGNYAKAEDAFAFITTLLPLPEVVNNQGVAASRHGGDGSALFEQAIAADSKDADYHFNLAVSFRRRNDTAGAQKEIEQSLKLRPNDSEAEAFATALKQEPSRLTPDNLPLERIKRSYNEASFRQAAFEIEQMQSMRLTTMKPADRAATLAKEGNQYLGGGLILEAERQFQLAVQADPANVAALVGLAQVRERSGDDDGARKVAQDALKVQPNVTAYMVLARLDFKANKLGDAATEVSNALKVEPANSAARNMRQTLETKGQQVP